MPDRLILSRTRLDTFLICQRRFQLRYLRQLLWPEAPLSEQDALLQARGQEFHRLLERHFLGLPVELNEVGDSAVRGWWLAFQNSHLSWPNGRARPELTLTIPVGDHLLSGRFDLLISNNQSAHIFDWKTGKPRSEGQLRHDWQTRLYLAMIAESGGALGQSYEPAHIAITYWYVSEPGAPRTIQYSRSWHEQNWGEIRQLVGQIEAQLERNEWPLTEDWGHCRVCAYQAFCGRQAAGTAEVPLAEDEEMAAALPLEPNTP